VIAKLVVNDYLLFSDIVTNDYLTSLDRPSESLRWGYRLLGRGSLCLTFEPRRRCQ
jgi:hypothetical protein